MEGRREGEREGRRGKENHGTSELRAQFYRINYREGNLDAWERLKGDPTIEIKEFSRMFQSGC